jgi:hypothetical protein
MDIILVERNGTQVLVLDYCPSGICGGAWHRLIPHGADALAFATPSPAKRLFWSTVEFGFAIVGFLFLIGQAACDGWNHTDLTRP